MSRINLNTKMNYKQQQKMNSAFPSSKSRQTGNDFLQRRTLFEGKVPGPIRYEELVKGHDYEQKEGDQEILLMERNNSKLTFYDSTQQNSVTRGISSSVHNASLNSPTNNISVIRQHQSSGEREQQRHSEMDRFGFEYYDQQLPCTAAGTLKDGVTNVSPTITRTSLQPSWTQLNNNNGNNFSSTGGYRWSTGQMEVISTNNVQSQQKAYPSSQTHSSEYKIPTPYSLNSSSASLAYGHETKKPRLYQSPDQQLKYIKQSQQQSKSLYQTGNSIQMAYHNPAQYYTNANLDSSPNSSATITKIPQIQTPTRTYFDSYGVSHGVGNDGTMGNNIKSISTKSKPIFKQKLQPQTGQTSPRAALEHYEKLRKYWDYQHHLLSEDMEYKNYCNRNDNNYATPTHYGSNGQPVNVNWQNNKNYFTQVRPETTVDLGNFHQTSSQTLTSTTSHNEQLKGSSDHFTCSAGTSMKTASGFAAELEKLQNYHFTHGQQRREWGWPYTSKQSPPTLAQRKTYPNNNSCHDVSRQPYVQQFYKDAEIQRKQPPFMTGNNLHVPKPPPVPPSTPNYEMGMAGETSAPLPQRRSGSIIQSIPAEVDIVDFMDSKNPGHSGAKNQDNQPSNKGQREVERFPNTKDLSMHSGPKTTPADLSLIHRRSDQDQMLLLNRRMIRANPPSPQRSKSVGGVTDVSGYDHIVLLDKRVMTYMCKRCLETLKSDQEIRNHLFCKMLQDSIQCHVCRNFYTCEDYSSHLKGHGVRAFSN